MKKRFPWFLLPCIAAFAAVIAVSVFLIYTLVLRTGYKEDALEINEAFHTHSEAVLSRGDLSFKVQTTDIEYYDQFLLAKGTAVFSRKPVSETNDTIQISFGSEKLSFTGIEDGSAIALCWKTSEKEKHYIVRSQITIYQLNSYFENLHRKAG